MKTSLLPVTLFTLAYMAAATVWALVSGNSEFVFYIFVVLLLAGLVLFMDRRVHFHPLTFWLLSLWGLLHMVGGLVAVPETWPIEGMRVVYSWWLIPHVLKVDNVIHAYGFAVATWICWQALCAGAKLITPTFGLLTLCVLAGMGLGATNEIIEFLASMIAASSNVGGYDNTLWDLIWNMIGCVTAAVLIGVYNKPRSL